MLRSFMVRTGSIIESVGSGTIRDVLEGFGFELGKRKTLWHRVIIFIALS